MVEEQVGVCQEPSIQSQMATWTLLYVHQKVVDHLIVAVTLNAGKDRDLRWKSDAGWLKKKLQNQARSNSEKLSTHF